jgi:hypothetical protein
MIEHKPCPQCEIYREWLAQVSEEKKFFIGKSFHDGTMEDIPNTETDFPVIHRSISFSGLRNRLETELRARAKSPTVVVEKQDLTPAEKTFLEELDNGRKANI